MRLAALTFALAVLFTPLVARGQDDPRKKSQELLGQATKLVREKDADIDKVRSLAEKAVETNPENVQARSFLAWLYDVKLGDGDSAIKHVDAAIRAIPDPKDNGHKQFKADLIATKARLLYSYKDDLESARDLFKVSLETFPLSTTADMLSNLLHRLGGFSKDAKKKKEQNEAALKYANEALELAPYMSQAKRDPSAQKRWLAKVKLQVALCKEVLGDAEGAKKALATVDPEDLSDATLYNQALLDALHGDEKATRDKLAQFMRATRPEPRSRNQLRKFIRSEPDFQKWVHEQSWKELVEDEAEGK